MNKPSKGPWFAGTPPSCCRWMFDVRSESGKTVALIGYGEYSSAPQEERANARLIASAPELLEALEACARSLEFCAEEFRRRNLGEEDVALEHLGQARAAIAKAKGES